MIEKKQKKINNKAIAPNILHSPHNTEEIRYAYKLKYNLKGKNQLILLMITGGKTWHYLAVKKLSAFLRQITSNHVGDFYCLSFLHSYTTEDLKSIKTYAKIMIIAM